MAVQQRISRTPGVQKLYARDGSVMKLVTRQKLDPFADLAAKGRSHDVVSFKRPMNHVACVPVAVQMQWLEQFGLRWWVPQEKARLILLLDHPDWKWMKFTDKRLFDKNTVLASFGD